MSPAWQLLHLSTASTTLPPLLVSAEFASNAYSVRITDLTYLWSESLDRRGIIKRSLDVETSIDPSEDAQQMSVFLEKLQAALGGSKNTTLSIVARPGGTPEGPPPLEVDITVELPKGLSPLKWPLHLKSLPQAAFSSQVIFPVLQAHNARLRELGGLVELLKNKDHVIQKLIDKVESTGAELGHVFPGAAGKGGRTVPRTVAEERVKGLRAFDAGEWKKEMSVQEEKYRAEEMSATVAKMFEANDGPTLTCHRDQESPEGWANWWTQVKDDPIELSTNKVKNNTEANFRAPTIQKRQKPAVQDDDDDFQIQSTPHRRLNIPAPKAESPLSSHTLRSQAAVTDSTDEDDLNGPSQPSAIPASIPRFPPRPVVKKLGTIGRPNPVPATAQAKAPALSSKPIQAKLSNAAEDDDETPSGDEDDSDHPPKTIRAPNKIPAPSPAANKKTRPIGRIGTNPTPLHSPPSKTPPKPKIGLIGRKSKPTKFPPRETTEDEEEMLIRYGNRDRDSESESEEITGRGGGRAGKGGVKEEMNEGGEREREKEKEMKKERESSQERADRKREELKRRLEGKVRGPVKKRRRF